MRELLGENHAVVKERNASSDPFVPGRRMRGNRQLNVKSKSGGAEGDRTPDLLNANQALSQLSYCPVIGAVVEVLIQRASWWAEQELHL